MKVNKLPHYLKIEKSLGPLESEVMSIVWGRGETNVKEITKAIQNKRPVAYTTVMTIMDKLFRKGFLSRELIGKAYQYFPTEKRNAVNKNDLATAIQDLSSEYGKVKVTAGTLVLIFSGLAYPHFHLKINPEIISVGKSAVYSFTMTGSTIIFGYSTWDLIQNLNFYGTSDYLNLTVAEPAIALNHFNLFLSALVESIPIQNLSVTIVSLSFLIFSIKKLTELINLDLFVWPKLERLA